MGLLATADLNALFDYWLSGYLKAQGTAASGQGIGDASADPTTGVVTPGTFGAFVPVDTALTYLGATGNVDAVVDIGRGLRDFRNSLLPLAIYGGDRASGFLEGFDRHARNFGAPNFSDLNTWLTYLNVGGGGTWQAQQHYTLGLLYKQTRGQSRAIDAWNLYYEILAGTLYPNAAGLLTFNSGAGVFVNGGAVPQSAGAWLYSGGEPYLVVAALAGTGTVTVTGVAFDPATELFAVGKTWTGNVVANGDLHLTPGGGSPAPANAKMVDVTAMAAVAGLTGGTAKVELRKPAGRL